MIYILGLGNPGNEYQETPHNIGKSLITKILEKLAAEYPNFSPAREDRKFKRSLVVGDAAGSEMTFIIPHTFMNLSGATVADLKKTPEQLVVVYDDIDLPFGEIRIAFDRGDGGHNGIKDIVKVLGTRAFIRIRVGVMPRDLFGKPRKPKSGLAVNNYLTKKKLGRRQMQQYEELSKKVMDIIFEIGKNGRVAAMNKFN